MRALLLVMLASCDECSGIKEIGGGAGFDLGGLFDLVRECDSTRGGVELVELELCSPLSDDELEQSLDENGFEGTTCWATRRHLGPCLHCCGASCGPGSNAFNGSWCPP